jgi:hypothetical protein
MSSIKLKRRTLLRGVGGAALAVPALEAMAPSTAEAAPPPKRLVVIYGGVSIGGDSDGDKMTPLNAGFGYDLKTSMLPIGTGALPSPGVGGNGYDVQAHTSIVSGLTIPWDTGGGVPAGGKSPEFHYNSMGPLLSGMRGDATRNEPPNGPTVDQIVAASIAGNTPFQSLSYRVQAASYVGSNSTSGSSARISYRDNNGSLEAIDPIFSPQLAYSTLFGNFIPPDPELAVAAELRLRRHKSVIDLVLHRAQKLMSRVGSEDRQRLERHLDELRALEIRLDSVPPIGGACFQPDDPGDDPPVEGSAIEYQGQGGTGAGYSNEELRATLLFEMINRAFACDLSRVAAVRMTWTQCHMQMADMIGFPGDLHEMGHGTNPDGLQHGVSWHVKHFARLLDLLRGTQELDGTNLLDHTAVVLLFEGGLGYDPEGDRNDSAHSTEGMVALVGGHAGGLNPNGGQHIVKTGAHPAEVLVSVMNAVGLPLDTLGEITGTVPELFT